MLRDLLPSRGRWRISAWLAWRADADSVWASLSAACERVLGGMVVWEGGWRRERLKNKIKAAGWENWSGEAKKKMRSESEINQWPGQDRIRFAETAINPMTGWLRLGLGLENDKDGWNGMGCSVERLDCDAGCGVGAGVGGRNERAVKVGEK